MEIDGEKQVNLKLSLNLIIKSFGLKKYLHYSESLIIHVDF